jgi:hypothetical protein
MNLFGVSDLKAFQDTNASDPAYDLARKHTRNQLVWLHERMYPEIRARRWDIYFRPEWSFTDAAVSERSRTVDALRVRYCKSEYVARLMQKQYGGMLTDDNMPWLGVGVDGRGVLIEWQIPAHAKLDAQNFHNKLVRGAPEKKTVRQVLAELGGEGVLTLIDDGREVLQARCSRLVDLNVLNTTLEKYVPGKHTWNLAIRMLVTDNRLQASSAPDEILYRLAQLYGLYQFAIWSPKNNYLDADRRSVNVTKSHETSIET